MSEKNPGLNERESRKRLLLAESELNREQMVRDIAALGGEVRAIGDRIKTFEKVAASAAVVVSGLAALRMARPKGEDGKPSWLRTAVKVGGLITTLWRAVRPGRLGVSTRPIKPAPNVEEEGD